MPYCTNCGAEYKQGAKFCGECGANTGDAAAAPAHPARTGAAPGSGSGPEVELWQGKPAGISDRLKGIFGLNTTTYTITSQRIMVKTGLIGKDIEEIELLRVNDFSVAQSIPDRILGIGTLTIFSDDASSPQLLFRKIRKAQTVKDILRKAVRDEKIANNISYREQI
ncbi:PH domain-containing protein [Paenibacillus sp. HW567]|uniref:PH domain-containing protein n=1 Tax=Paenibacillus sp. HW567 TaxID=1034769 RepID=UPI00036FD596|nr:PH domain-containing protein [Paenibacillus sp. HW567]